MSKAKNYQKPVNLRFHHVYDVPPVCGRMALGAVSKLNSATYRVATTLKSTVVKRDKEGKWLKCINANVTNCRKAYFCWEKSVNRMCGIDELCCPGGRTD